MIVDTHSHIFLDEFDDDRAAIMERAEKESVTTILLPAIDTATHGALFETETVFPGRCLSMMGLHPCSVKENYKQELAAARTWLEKRKFVGVGEIGLDFYWDKTFTQQQYDAFHQQL
jgi:TatD DNase family protein